MATVERPAAPELTDRTWMSLRSAIDTAIAGHPRYPEGTAFVPADLPDFAAVVRRYRSERAPVIVIHEDGSEELISAGPPALDIETLLLGLAAGAGIVLLLDRITGR